MNNVGRPKKYTTQELKDIIDNYVANTKGLYKINATKVANYGVEVLGFKDLKYYIFNRNMEVKQYIKNMNQLTQGEHEISLGDTVFNSLDIQAYCKLSSSDLTIALKNLNQYIYNVINSNTKILNENKRLKEEILNYSLKQLSDQKNRSEKEILLASEKESLKRDIEIIKNDLGKIKSEKKKLETAIEILWEQEATNILKRLGLLTLENDREIESKLIVDSVKEDISKIEKSLEDMMLYQEEDTIITFDFKNKIRDL
ncbi:hypothetical protein QTL86_02015 [Cellulosilyticum sp. ST5]|uniref:hypothetical protein n=1 Tax=Cellulosilyticum sp. ST5 TaxID=3055805 RepID=UPI003977D00F